MTFLSRYTGGLTDRYGPRVPLVLGPAVAAVSFVLFAVPGLVGSYWTTFFPATVVLGVGLSIVVPAVTTVALNSVDVGRSGLASAINNAFSQTAGLLAVAVLGVLMFSVFGGALDARLENLDLPVEARQYLEGEKAKLGGAEVPEALAKRPAAAVERAIDGAFLFGYRVVMFVIAGVALASALSAALLIKSKGRRDGVAGAERAGGGGAPA
jgi:MFS family permease